MKKFIFILSIIVSLFFIGKVYSHPLDISVSTAAIKSNIIQFTTYFHTFEIEYLLKNNGIKPDGVNYYYNNSKIITDYVKSNLEIQNNQKNCIIEDISLIEEETYKVLSQGLGVSYKVICEDTIQDIDIDIRYFIEFPLQTNRVTFYDLNHGLKNKKALFFKVLTSKINNIKVDIRNIKNIQESDVDGDGLSDEEEKIYRTDKNKVDSDGDNYSDKEEVNYGWDPLNRELGPGQEYREKLIIKQNIKDNNNFISQIPENDIEKLSDYGYGNNYLMSAMKYINSYFEKNNGSLFIIFCIIFGLGVLHAAGPGHAKSLLVSYTLERQNGYKKGILFAGIFTVTHIIDIIILFIITKVIISFIDISKYTYYIQIISATILLFLSIYLIYKAGVQKTCNHSRNKSLLIAFLAGLAPCSFAWSIFLLLIALGKSIWIIPLILALSLGIFTTLVGVVLLSVYLKNKVYERVGKLSMYSQYFSAGIIMIISIYMLYKIIIV